jgi:hypothetical protein
MVKHLLSTLGSLQHSSSLSKAQSAEAICELIFAAISEICYSRNILSLSSFDDVCIRGQDNFMSKVVREGDSELAKSVYAWCKDIGPSIRKDYVIRVSFGISDVEDLKTILEEYMFHIDLNQTISMSAGSGNQIQAQTIDILQSMNLLAQTLDPMPVHRPLYAFIKLYHSDTCPKSHIVHGLSPAGKEQNNGISYYESNPFQMKIGTMVTNYHSVTIGVCSMLDSIDVRPGQGPVPDNLGIKSTTTENVTSAAATKVPGNTPISFKNLGSRQDQQTPRSARLATTNPPLAQEPMDSRALESSRPVQGNSKKRRTGRLASLKI